MTCDEVLRLLAGNEELPAGASDHLRICEACRCLHDMPDRLASDAITNAEAPFDSAMELRLIACVLKDLTAVRTIASPRWCVAAFLAASALIASVGIAMLGVHGWRTNPSALRIYFSFSLTVSILVCAFTLPRLMIPGARLRFAPRTIVFLSLGVLTAGCLAYPLLQYQHFGRAVAACFSIGMVLATATGALCAVILRRGFVLAPQDAAALCGLLGGLSAFVVLFVFCPHLDMGHYMLAHCTVVLASTVLGALIAAIAHR